MRLIDTRQSLYTLTEVHNPTGKAYAILSHRWSEQPEDEVSYEQFTQEGLTEEQFNTEQSAEERRQNSPGWSKIFNACNIARENGIDYVWIDTCCIDKRSSAELSEAINSMYAWYKGAKECYAFLDDVAPFELPEASSGRSDDDYEEFRGSKWFKRGWTLQELLAPKTVLFYGRKNQTRVLIGTRDGLAEQIRKATGIGRTYLKSELGASRSLIHSASVAQRMSWASHRLTTRPEDIAYSLLGIFGVSMPLLYGEGEDAFKRLQLRIIAQTTDDSIFAWGIGKTDQLHGMLADRPRDFEHSGDVTNDSYDDQATTQADLNAVVHMSLMPIHEEVFSYFVGGRHPTQDSIRLRCTQKLGKDPYTIWLTVKREKDKKYYRTAAISCSTRGLRAIPVALQQFVTTPKQVSVSSLSPPNPDTAEMETAESKDWWRKVPAASTLRTWDYIRLAVVALIVLIGSTTQPACSTDKGKGGCDAAILVTVLVFFLRDLFLNRVQFWTVLIIWGLVSRLPSIGTESSPSIDAAHEVF